MSKWDAIKIRNMEIFCMSALLMVHNSEKIYKKCLTKTNIMIFSKLDKTAIVVANSKFVGRNSSERKH